MYRQTAQTSNPLLPQRFKATVTGGFCLEVIESSTQLVLYLYLKCAGRYCKVQTIYPSSRLTRRKADVSVWKMAMSYKDTELTLGLPGGGSRGYSTGGGVFGELMKRGFIETLDDPHDLDLLSSTGEEFRGQVKQEDEQSEAANYSSIRTSTTAVKAPTAKDQVVGWPPVRSTRNKALDSKNLKNISSSKYVKVGADGAPYLRKVDLEMYTSYEELLTALEKIFTSFTKNGKQYMEDDRKQQVLLMKHAVVNGMVEYNQYVLTYEDKDNDWMLVGDVPWKMFKESCKRIRLMKCSESVVRN